MIRACAAGLLALVVALSAGPASAQGDEGEGRRRWKHGQDLYDQGRYLDAAREFEAGYAVAPRPLFFLSIGHAYRKAHELAKAKAAYEKLLTLQPDFPGRSEVEGYIRSINDALQVVEPARDTAAPAPIPGLAPSPLPAPPASPPSDLAGTASPYPSGPLLPAAPPPPAMIQTSIAETPAAQSGSSTVLSKPWFWVIVGAVAAGSIAAAVIAAHPSSSCPGTICIRETQ